MNPVARFLGAIGVFAAITVGVGLLMGLAARDRSFAGSRDYYTIVGGLSLVVSSWGTWAFLRRTASKPAPPASGRPSAAVRLIIPAGGLTGRIEPHDTSPRACRFDQGELVTVLERRDGWTHLTGPADRSGWVKTSTLPPSRNAVFRCPKCRHETAATTQGRCAYCDRPLTAENRIE
jgi:hypothetical protein